MKSTGFQSKISGMFEAKLLNLRLHLLAVWTIFDGKYSFDQEDFEKQTIEQFPRK